MEKAVLSCLVSSFELSLLRYFVAFVEFLCDTFNLVTDLRLLLNVSSLAPGIARECLASTGLVQLVLLLVRHGSVPTSIALVILPSDR